MLLTVYGSDGTAKCQISPADSSTQEKEIGGDNVLSLSFTLYEYVELDVNDYIDFEGERYWLTEEYHPEEKSMQEWEYSVKFYGIESLIKRFLVLNTVATVDNPAVFTLTATPAEHVALVVASINAGMGTSDWKVGEVTGTDNIVVDYEGTYCNEALEAIAGEVGGNVEWWVEGQTVNIGRCELGEEIELGYNKGLTGMEQSTADNVKFYTRLYAVGSTKNIAPETYGYMRLILPGGASYVDIADRVAKYGIIHHYEADAFADIYPRCTCTVSAVRSETVEDDDGEEYKIYYFKGTGIDFNPNDYLLDGEVMRVSFQNGELAGLGEGDDHYFEVNYDEDTGEFEIITIWPYGDDTQLPNDTLIPAVGDEYILWNLAMPDEYVTAAEEEFAEAVDAYNEANCIDPAVIKCPTDYLWVEANGAELYVGRRVKLLSAEYWPETGYRSSRITKITRQVTLPGQMDLEIGDAVSIGAMSSVQESIDNVRSYVKQSATTLPDIIKTGDTTKPTDSNLFSARRSQKEFLSKKTADTAQGLIKFKSGLETGSYTSGSDGGLIDAGGNGELQSLVVRELLRSLTFVDGFTGEGWRLWKNGADWQLTIDRLTVRKLMTIYELLISKIRAVGGQLYVSAANGKVKSATLDDDGANWQITFEDVEHGFTAGDLMRCQTWTGSNVKYYWVEISAVDGSTVTVAASEFGDDNIPEEGDECVLMGNTSNADRQGVLLMSATEDGQPRFDVLNGISSKSTDSCLRARLGCLDGISDSRFPSDSQPQGYGIYSDNAYLRGTFLLVTGEDVATKFEVTEGKIESAVEALREDFVDVESYLNNATFGDGLSYWTAANDVTFWLAGTKWIWANGTALSLKNSGAFSATDDGRAVARIKNGSIRQLNGDMSGTPSLSTNADGEKEATGVKLTFYYRCVTAGTLTVGFENVETEGYADFDCMGVKEEIAVTDGYVQYTCSGLWNGTGDFVLSFTGEMYLYMLVLCADVSSTLTYKYATLFSQSDRLVQICAAVYDGDENALAETGLVVKPEGAGLYAQSADGSIALIGVSVDETEEVTTTDEEGNEVTVTVTKSVVKLTADHIRLEGLVTANENFKILEDGSIVAANGTFTGTINSTSGSIGSFVISEYQLTSTYTDGSQMLLSGYLLRFTDANKHNYVYLGSDVMPSTMGGAISCPMRIEVARTSDSLLYGNIGMYLDVTGSTAYDDKGYQYSGNHALYIVNGDICGFRLRVRRVKADQTLSDMDSVILTVGDDDITLTLPASPQDGQVYFFKQMSSGKYTLAVGDESHYINDGRTNRKSSWTITSGTIVMLVWDKTNLLWCAGFTNYN